MSLDVELLYTQEAAGLATYVRRRCDPAEAEDLAADVWERVVRAAPRYRDQGVRPTTWLYQIARNLLIDRHRTRRLPVVRLADWHPYGEHVGTDGHAARLDVQRALTHLTDLQRAVVVARAAEGRIIPEVMAAVGRGDEAVRRAHRNGILKLRALLGAA